VDHRLDLPTCAPRWLDGAAGRGVLVLRNRTDLAHPVRAENVAANVQRASLAGRLSNFDTTFAPSGSSYAGDGTENGRLHLRRENGAHHVMKHLYLLRHAKSDWSDTSIDDFARPLSRRGKRARRLIAGHVAGWQIDLVVCSPAVRAKATAEPLIGVLSCPVRYDNTMYAADADDLLVVTRRLPENTSSVMLVGHNPSVEEFTTMLCGLSPRFPTGALGTLELGVENWSDTSPGSGSLTGLVTPAQLAEARSDPPPIRWQAAPVSD
jgi:phosphohistidine phosphatase